MHGLTSPYVSLKRYLRCPVLPALLHMKQQCLSCSHALDGAAQVSAQLISSAI